MKRVALACNDAFGIAGILSPHFAKSPYFTFVNIEEGQVVGFDVFENPFLSKNRKKAIPRFIFSRKANVMIASEIDTKSLGLLKQLGIEVTLAGQGKVLDIVEAYLKGLC